MSSAKGVLGFIAGAVVGAVAGLAAGVLVAPRAGAETRDMLAQNANDAWDNVVDTYHKGAQEVVEKANEATVDLGAKSDELREKVDQARARMDQIRSSLAETAAARGEAAAEPVVEVLKDDAPADNGSAPAAV